MPDRQSSEVINESRVYRFRILFVIALITSLAMIGSVVYFSRLLRPGTDDYCFGLDANLGLIAGVHYWWENLNGYVLFIFGSMATVGMPLAYLPWGLVSSIPFLFAALFISLVTFQIILTMRPEAMKSSSLRLMIFVPIAGISWWTYLWLPIAWGDTEFNRSIGIGLTHFQSLNGSYVFTTVLVLSAVIFTWSLSRKKNRIYIFTALTAGLLAGFSGIMMSLTSLFTTFIILVYGFITRTESILKYRRQVYVFASATLLAAIIANTSPGSLKRAEGTISELNISPFTIARLVGEIFPASFQDVVLALINPGSLAVLLIMASTTWLLSQCGAKLQNQAPLGWAIFFAGLSLIASVATRFSEFFAYFAYWHFVDVRIFAFLGLVFLGLYLGSQLDRFPYTVARAIFSFLIFTSLALSSGALLKMGESIIERHSQWVSGPAPIFDIIADIENSQGYISGCWNDLAELRDTPERNSLSNEGTSDIGETTLLGLQ